MFFGGGAQPRTQSGLGTGFIVRKDGVIVTNAHVVAGATKISVMMRDGTVYPATVLGIDETNDLAVREDRRQESARREARQLEQPRHRRVGDRHRQSVRLRARQQRAERERRRRERDAAQPHRAGRRRGVVLRHDSDRRGDQSRATPADRSSTPRAK